jgi:glyoxylase-like metal-dependent hydrolase (beta-lactamase superfamily II)
MSMLQLGEFQLYCIVENRFHLDAGTAFGIVPRSIWGKLRQPDENNLLPFDTNVFLLKAHGKNILFDVGLGDYLLDKQKKLYGVESPSNLIQGLKALGIEPGDIDFVLLSHLHWDHAGSCITWAEGRPTVTFPNAQHYVHRYEWEDANHPDERTLGVYFPDRLQAIADAGLLQLLDENAEVLPGVKLVKIGGHTRGQMGVEVESNGEKLIYYADNFLSCHHLKIPYVAAMDLFPLDTQRCKRETLPKAAAEGWYIAMDHELEYKVVKIVYDGLKYSCVKVEI